MANQIVCDRCRRVINPAKDTKVTLVNEMSTKFKWDFCGKCFKAFEMWIAMGIPSEG